MQINLDERKDLLDNLNSIRTTLHLMANIYQQAIAMVSVIYHFVRDLQVRGESSTPINVEGTEQNSQHRARFQASNASINSSISNLTFDDDSMPTPIFTSSSSKRPFSDTLLRPPAKRPHLTNHLPTSILTSRILDVLHQRICLFCQSHG